MIVAENDQRNRPSAAFCSSIRQQYGLTMPVLYDRDGDYVRALGVAPNHFHWVLGRENMIRFKRQYDDTGWRPVLDAELAR